MMRLWLFLCLAACGRIDFDPGARPLDGGPDAPAIDAALDPSLIAHYVFDDDPGDGFIDSTGHGHTATCSSCPVVAPAAARMAASFDGVDDVLAVTDDLALRPAAISVALWVNLRSAVRQGIVQKIYGTAKEDSWQLYIDGVGALAACATSCTGSTLPVPTNSWHHIAYVATGATQDVFLDGVRVASMPATLQYDGSEILIGADHDDGADYAFVDGYLDDLRIYSRALSDAEVAALAAE